MPAVTPDPNLINLWRRALTEEFGIEVTTDKPSLRDHLYASRQLAADPALDALQLCTMADGTFWIVKKDVSLEDGDAPALR